MKKARIETIINNNRCALHSMTALKQTLHNISLLEAPIIKQHDITLTQFGVLETLYIKGDMRIQDLIDTMLTTSGNMTVVIKNMIRDGLIVRQPNPTDKRACIISLTEKGALFIENILPEHYQNIGKIFSVLDEQDCQTLNRILNKFKSVS